MPSAPVLHPTSSTTLAVSGMCSSRSRFVPHQDTWTTVAHLPSRDDRQSLCARRAPAVHSCLAACGLIAPNPFSCANPSRFRRAMMRREFPSLWAGLIGRAPSPRAPTSGATVKSTNDECRIINRSGENALAPRQQLEPRAGPVAGMNRHRCTAASGGSQSRWVSTTATVTGIPSAETFTCNTTRPC